MVSPAGSDSASRTDFRSLIQPAIMLVTHWFQLARAFPA